MQDFTTYSVTKNMRWDTIAYECYGDATKYEPIIAANEKLTIGPVVYAGVVLRIPVLTGDINIIPQDSKPPWQ